MKNEFVFEISETIKKIATDYEDVIFKAGKNTEDESIYNITSEKFEGIEHYRAEEVLHNIAEGHWVMID